MIPGVRSLFQAATRSPADPSPKFWISSPANFSSEPSARVSGHLWHPPRKPSPSRGLSHRPLHRHVICFANPYPYGRVPFPSLFSGELTWLTFIFPSFPVISRLPEGALTCRNLACHPVAPCCPIRATPFAPWQEQQPRNAAAAALLVRLQACRNARPAAGHVATASRSPALPRHQSGRLASPGAPP